MNTRISPRGPQAAAFTLIELLTVIAIIAVLMALLFSGVFSAKNQARRAEAAAALRDIGIACKSFETDYGRFPKVPKALIVNGSGDGFYAYGDVIEGKCAVSNNVLFDCLRAIDRGENANNELNPRGVVYIGTKVAADKRNPRSGFCDGNEFTSNQGQYMDSWGAQYCVVLSASGKVEIDMSRFFLDLAGPEGLVRVSAAGFSMGTDGKRGGKGYEGRLQKPNSSEAPDDVVSWK